MHTDDKPRITALITILANGCQLPGFFILKHSKSSYDAPDQTSMRVIPNLQARTPEFGILNGWTEMEWDKTIVDPSTDNVVRHFVRYLYNRDTHHVITSQCNAWNDEVRMLMYLDLILKPYMERQFQGACHK